MSYKFSDKTDAERSDIVGRLTDELLKSLGMNRADFTAEQIERLNGTVEVVVGRQYDNGFFDGKLKARDWVLGNIEECP